MGSDSAQTKIMRILYITEFLLTGGIVLLFSLFMGKSYEELLRNTIVSFIMAGTVVFMLADASKRGTDGFLFDNYLRRNRFFVVYLIMVILSCLFSLIPNTFWPYLSAFVILALFSNCEIGLTAGTCLVMISVMLEQNGAYPEMFTYVIAGAAAIALFRDLNEDTSIGLPAFTALLMQAVLLVAYDVLFQNRTLSLSLLMTPVLNLMLNLMILMVFLNIFGVYVLRKSNDMYMEINDTEYPLLTALKESNRDEYFRAIHTAYLAERIARELSINARAVKNCSYYHRIGIPGGEKKWEQVEHYYTENRFPQEAVDLLHEYIEPAKGQNRSKEALTVLISETVVASIMYLLKKDKDAKIDYDKLIDRIMDNKVKAGELINYNVTYREYDIMRKVLKKEKLYYDFLR